MVTLLNALNGKIITPNRYKQFKLLCTEVGITPKQGALKKDSPWLAGFFDADGCVTVDRDTSLHVSITQVDATVLEPLPAL